MIRSPISSALKAPIATAFDRRGGGVAGPSVGLVQETEPVYFNGDSTTSSVVLTFDQASASGNTLIVHATMSYWSTVTITDSAGGTVAGGQWSVEIDSAAFGAAGDGDPLANTADRQYVWVRRNCPAGLTNVTVAQGGNFTTRVYLREVSGLSNVAPIVRTNSRNVASQSALTVSVSGAGFMSSLVRTNPSRTPVSASADSVVRRLNFLSDNVTPYTGAVSEHTLHGISTGARSFNSSWADGATTIGHHGIFIPAA